jgi:hypothetical protein
VSRARELSEASMRNRRSIIVWLLGGALAALALTACSYLSGQNTSCPAVQEISDPSTVALPPMPKPPPKEEVEPSSVAANTATPEPVAPPEVVDAGTEIARADAGAKKPPVVAVAPVATAAAAPACGDKANPCPMQKFMRTTMTGASTPDALAAGFARLVGASPNGGWTWSAIAKKGVESAKAGDTAAAKQQCKACHDQYRNQYKQQYRARKF